MALDIKPVSEKSPSEPQKELALAPGQTSWKTIALLALWMGVLLTVVYLSPLRGYLSDWLKVSEEIRSFGTLAPLVLTLGVALLVAIGVPRLVFCVIAGMALGFWSGLLWAQLGTLLGNYAFFVVVRAGFRPWAERLLAKRARFHATIQQRGTLGVVLARQLPLPGLVVNATCALLPIGHVDYLVGTIIGQLPQAIPATLIGAGTLQPSFGKAISFIGLAVMAAILAWVGLRIAMSRAAHPKT